MRSICILLYSCLAIGCLGRSNFQQPESTKLDNRTEALSLTSASPVPETTISPEPPLYPGVTIDQQFPIISEHSLSDEPSGDKTFDIEVLGYDLNVLNCAPTTLSKNSKKQFQFKTLSPNDYWSNLVGVSSLLGSDSKEIYVVSTGPGAVCCTNYWIIDVSSATPRCIFRSEEFGNFRDAMEIFAADGDGVYELVQYDSCFRYFMEDCGTCTPEPRAVFKYDEILRQYRPAAGIMQDFVRSQMVESEERIDKMSKSLKAGAEPAIQLDLDREVLDHFVQLLHFGQENKAWRFYKKYNPNSSKKVLAEIKFRLASCKFYQKVNKK